MKKFIKYIIIYSIPLAVAFMFYAMVDPFKVVWHYDNYYTEPYWLTLNMDYIGTTNYDNKRDLYHYDSFILGNSRSRCWRIEDWKKYIGNDISGYHMDGHGECQLGLERKVEYICAHSDKVKNVLMIIDQSVFTNPDRCTIHFRYLSPRLDHYKNFIAFHVANFKAFYTPQFLMTYLKYKFYDKGKGLAPEGNLFVKKDYYDPIRNEYLPMRSEKKIEEGSFYDKERLQMFKDKQYPDSIFPVVITEDRQERLIKMAELLKSKKTNVKIVISPLYDQIKMNPKDVDALKKIFGTNNVYDFSGDKNITKDYHNYYEDSHYRIGIADSLLKIIYNHD